MDAASPGSGVDSFRVRAVPFDSIADGVSTLTPFEINETAACAPTGQYFSGTVRAACGDPVPCHCPPFWHGVVPPACPQHNPSMFGGTVGYGTTFTMPPQPQRLSDDDVERIAKRVAEILQGGKT